MVKHHFPMPIVTRITILMLFWILLFVFLTEFRDFLYPICFGILFAYALYPIANGLEEKGFPRILANIISIIIGIIIVYGSIFFIYKQISVFLQDLPSMERQAMKNIDTVIYQIGQTLSIEIQSQEENIKSTVREIFKIGKENIKETISATFNTLFPIFILPVYIFFFLYNRNKFKFFIKRLTPKAKHATAEKTIKEISAVTQRYMTGIFFVVLILCFVNSFGLWIIGLEHAILLGVIAAILNFIPYFGTVIGYSIPFVVAMLTHDSPRYAVGVAILFIIVQFAENNILTPSIVGGKVSVNPFFIILGVLFGGALWGIPGMFIVIPFLAMAKVVCDNIPELRPWGYLIGDRGNEQHALTANKIKRFFLNLRNR